MRLRSDVPVGVYLSGGMDSSSVACIAARLAGGPVQAFTIGFDDAAYDETESARQLARRYGLEHHVLPVRRSDLADHFVRSLWHSEITVANTHGTAKLLLSELAPFPGRENGVNAVFRQLPIRCRKPRSYLEYRFTNSVQFSDRLNFSNALFIGFRSGLLSCKAMLTKYSS